MKKKVSRIYLDYASTTPLDPKVLKAMLPWFTKNFGNPSALYEEGLIAKKALRESKDNIASILNARPHEIVFTASGTEANNLAISGVCQKARSEGKKIHIVTTSIEHPSILAVCEQIEKWGGVVTYISPDEYGLIDPKKVRDAITEDTVLVSVMYANNEIGTVEPIQEIAKAVRFAKGQMKREGIAYPYFHVDASQASLYLNLHTNELGVDMMTLDAQKIYGPKGIGCLYIKSGVKITPIIFGGGQEKGLRSGTENVPAIVGFAKAMEIADSMREKESARLCVLRDYMTKELLQNIKGATLNGHETQRLPNNINICVPNLDAEFAVISLSEKGIACSSVSACKNLSDSNASYVIEALGEKGKSCKESSLRFSLGRETTKKDIMKAIKAIVEVCSNIVE